MSGTTHAINDRNREGGTIPFPPQPEGMLPDHLSPTSIRLYLTCSLKYYFKKVLGLSEPASPSLVFGRAVHEALRAVHLHRWRGRQGDERDAALRAFREAMAGEAANEGLGLDEDEKEKFDRLGEAVVGEYLGHGHASGDGRPLGVEVKLEGDFPEIPSPLTGYVDLVRKGNVPVDFKTCASTPNADLEAHQHDLQLTGYQLLLEAATGQKVEGRELVFLVKTKKPKVIVHRLPPATETDKKRFWLMARAMADGIRENRFHPQPGVHCAWCAFREECARFTGETGKGVISHG